MNVDALKPFLGKVVTLHMTDGEVAKVRVQWVDDEYGDIVADVLTTTRSDHYRDGRAAYTFLATEILSVIPCE